MIGHMQFAAGETLNLLVDTSNTQTCVHSADAPAATFCFSSLRRKSFRTFSM